jgi:hypothetical protein
LKHFWWGCEKHERSKKVAGSLDGAGSDYKRTSEPAMLSYDELVALGDEEPVEPALAAKLHALLTTRFINNEAYFNGLSRCVSKPSIEKRP